MTLARPDHSGEFRSFEVHAALDSRRSDVGGRPHKK